MIRSAKAPVKRGPGRPKRIDGLDSNSSAARKARGTPMISLTLPAATLETLDAIAAHLGCSRGAAVVTLVGLGVEHGLAAASSAATCAFGGCTAPADGLALGRLAHGRVASFCGAHRGTVADEGSPEYVVDCPHCGCLFGVN